MAKRERNYSISFKGQGEFMHDLEGRAFNVAANNEREAKMKLHKAFVEFAKKVRTQVEGRG
jgi:hypothetical protein